MTLPFLHAREATQTYIRAILRHRTTRRTHYTLRLQPSLFA